jgi:hypothetical protein
MNRAIEFIFDILPPEQGAAPETDNRVATTMLLQSWRLEQPSPAPFRRGCLLLAEGNVKEM